MIGNQGIGSTSWTNTRESWVHIDVYERYISSWYVLGWMEMDSLQEGIGRNLVSLDEHIGRNGDVIGRNGKTGDVHR
jgi:hypothetical protein